MLLGYEGKMSITIKKDIYKGVMESRISITKDDVEVVSINKSKCHAPYHEWLVARKPRVLWSLGALVDSHNLPEKDIRFLVLPILQAALFDIIKDNFYIPFDSAKITDIFTNVEHIVPHLSKYRLHPWPEKLVMVRIEASAMPCEPEHNKCMKCERRYRCITQRKA